MFNRKAKNLELALEVQESRSFWQDVGRRFIRNNKTIIGLVMLAIIVLMCLYGMIFLDYETQVINQDIPNKLQTPSQVICLEQMTWDEISLTVSYTEPDIPCLSDFQPPLSAFQ